MPICPDEQALAAWVNKHGSASSRAAIEAHAARCADCRRCVSELARLEFSSKGMGEGSSPGLAPPLRRGSMVNRYVVLDVIGAGAMGIVYAAYDPELDRKIALKVIGPRAPASASENATRDWLAREAQAMARLSDPHVVSVYDTGPYGSQVFVAMEIFEGVTLRLWLNEQPRSVGATLEAFLAAGRGLAAVHRAGLVHRDFKPDNVLIANDGRVCVTDFGLARLDQAPDEHAAVVGTPAYMAPAQLEGAVADARSDQFSFCVALFEAVYRERPFKAGSSAELVRAVETGVVPPVRYPPGSARLLPILLRGLHADPAKRFPDMETLLTALARDPVRQWQGAIALALVIMLVAVMSIAIGQRLSAQGPDCARTGAALTGIWDPTRREAVRRVFSSVDVPQKERIWSRVVRGLDAYTQDWLSRRRATCEAENARSGAPDEQIVLQNRCLDRRLSVLGALTELFAQATPQVVQRATNALADLPSLRDCDVAQQTELRGTEQALKDADDEHLSAQINKLRMLLTTGASKEARTLAETVARDAEARQSSLLAEALFYEGYVRLIDGDFKEKVAEVFWRAALVAQATHDDEVRVRSLAKLVSIMGQLGSPMQRALANWYAKEADAVLKRMGGAPRYEMDLINNVATLLTMEERNDEALAQLQGALAVLESSPDNGWKRMARGTLLNNIGNVYGHMRRYEDALPYIQQALSIQEELLGPEHSRSVLRILNVGDALYATGRYAEARSYLERALALYRRSVGTESRRELQLLTSLAATMDAQGETQHALSIHLEALSVAERVLDRTDSLWKEPLLGLGKFYLKHDQPQQAIPHLERGLSAVGSVLSSANLADLQFALARALAAAGRDPSRVDELATAARKAYAAAKWQRDLGEVTAFLARRGVKQP